MEAAKHSKPTLETVRFLQREGLEKLCKRFHVNKKAHHTFPNLVGFKYDQVRANFSSRIVRECRGLILDADANWAIIAWPFLKFFNCGESFAESIDWDSAHVYEKLDGSLCTLYFYRNEWHVSSVGMPDGAGKLAGDTTFAELFWDIWKKLKYQYPKVKTACYMFEMLTDRNRILVPQRDERLVLLGSRCLLTLAEELPERTPFASLSLSELVMAARTLNPMENEGWVVCDKNFKRLKIKSPQYVALSHMSERNKNPRVNVRNMAEIVRANEGSEFLAYFPEWKPAYERTKSAFDELVAALENKATATTDHDDALTRQCRAALADGSASSVRSYLATCPIEMLVASLRENADDGANISTTTDPKEGTNATDTAEVCVPAPSPAAAAAAAATAAAAAAAAAAEPLRQQPRRKKQGAPVNPFALLQGNNDDSRSP